jgi:exosortase
MAIFAESPATTAKSDTEAWSLAKLIMTVARDREQWPWGAGVALSVLLFLLLFRDNVHHFYYAWSTDENYSHGFLVPFLSLYFANRVARDGPVRIRAGVVVGSLLLLMALLGRLVSIPLPIPFVGDVSFVVGLAGLFTLVAGSEALKRYWFAFFFLVFMVPLPIALYSRIASPLQILASRVASALMNLAGVPVLCEGNRMTLPGGLQLFVAEACSGMRQLTGFLALTTAVAYLASRPGWYRSLVVISALPIALSANIARIILTGSIMHFINPRFALGTYHTLEGLLMMGVGLLLLQIVCGVLDQLDRPGPPRYDPGPHVQPQPVAVGSS